MWKMAKKQRNGFFKVTPCHWCFDIINNQSVTFDRQQNDFTWMRAKKKSLRIAKITSTMSVTKPYLVSGNILFTFFVFFAIFSLLRLFIAMHASSRNVDRHAIKTKKNHRNKLHANPTTNGCYLARNLDLSQTTNGSYAIKSSEKKGKKKNKGNNADTHTHITQNRLQSLNSNSICCCHMKMNFFGWGGVHIHSMTSLYITRIRKALKTEQTQTGPHSYLHEKLCCFCRYRLRLRFDEAKKNGFFVVPFAIRLLECLFGENELSWHL